LKMLPAEADRVAIEHQRRVLPRIFTPIESKASTLEYELANPVLISKANFAFWPPQVLEAHPDTVIRRQTRNDNAQGRVVTRDSRA
jgi:hypothetical protein